MIRRPTVVLLIVLAVLAVGLTIPYAMKLRTQANVPSGEYFAKKPLFPERLAVPGPGSKSVVPLEPPATKTFPKVSVVTELPLPD